MSTILLQQVTPNKNLLVPRGSNLLPSHRAAAGKNVVPFSGNPSYLSDKPPTTRSYINVPPTPPTTTIETASPPAKSLLPNHVIEETETMSIESGSGSDLSDLHSPLRENESPPLIDDFSDDEEILAKSLRKGEQGVSESSESSVDVNNSNGHTHTHAHSPLSRRPMKSKTNNNVNVSRSVSFGGDMMGIATDDYSDDNIDPPNPNHHQNKSQNQRRMPSATAIATTPKPNNNNNKLMSRRNRLNNIDSIVSFFKYFHRYKKEDLLKAFRRIQRLQDITKIFTMNVEQYKMSSRLLELLREYCIGGNEEEIDHIPIGILTMMMKDRREETEDNFYEGKPSSPSLSPTQTQIQTQTSEGTITGKSIKGDSQYLGNESVVIELLRICNELVILPIAKEEILDAQGRDSLGISHRDVYHTLNVCSFNSHRGLLITYRIMMNYVGRDKTGLEKEILSLFLRFISALGSYHEAPIIFGYLKGCDYMMKTLIPAHMFDPIVLAEALQCIANMSLNDQIRQQFLSLGAFHSVEEILYLQKGQSHMVECACNAFTSLATVPVRRETSHGHVHLPYQLEDENDHHHYHHPIASVALCELLTEVLDQHKLDSKPIVSICKTIIKIATTSIEVAGHLARAGCCELIVEVLTIHVKSAEVIEYATMVIQKLAVIPENRRLFGIKPNHRTDSISGCELLLQILKKFRGNRYVIAPTCFAIKALTLDETNQKILGDCLICDILPDLLMKHMQREHRECVEQILSVIWSMSTVEKWQKEFARREGFCETLVVVIEKFLREKRIAEKICGVIKNLALQPSLGQKLGYLRACELLTAVLCHYGHCPQQVNGNSNANNGGNGGNSNGNGSQNGSSSNPMYTYNTGQTMLMRGTSSPLTKSNLSTVSNGSNSQLQYHVHHTHQGKGSNSDKGSQSGASSSASPYYQSSLLNRSASVVNPDREYNPRHRIREHERQQQQHIQQQLLESNDSTLSSPREDLQDVPATSQSLSMPSTTMYSGPGSDGDGSRRQSFGSHTSDTNSLTPSQTGPNIKIYRPLSIDEIKVVEQCLWAIWNMSVYSENEKKFGRLQTCHYLAVVLHHNTENPRIVEPACGAIKNLSVNKENVEKFVSQKVCELLVAVLSKYSTGLISNNLLSSNSMTISLPTTSANAASTGAATLTYAYDEGLYGLTSEYSDYSDVPRALSWQKQHLVILRQVCAAISHFAAFESPKHAIIFGNHGCCEILVSLMKSMAPPVRENFGNSTPSSRGSSQSISGGVGVSGSRDKRSDDSRNGMDIHQDLLVKLCNTMTDLAIYDENCKRFGEAGACGTLVEMCASFRERPSLLEPIFKLMKVFCNSDKNQMLLGEANGCAVIVEVLKLNVGNLMIMETAVACIQRLSEMQLNVERLGNRDAFQTLLGILTMHSAKVNIVREIMKCLHNLSFHENNRAILKSLNIVHTAKSLKTTHSKDASIVKSCDQLIKKIGGKRWFDIF